MRGHACHNLCAYQHNYEKSPGLVLDRLEVAEISQDEEDQGRECHRNWHNDSTQFRFIGDLSEPDRLRSLRFHQHGIDGSGISLEISHDEVAHHLHVCEQEESQSGTPEYWLRGCELWLDV